MSSKLILSLDLGTTGVRAILYRSNGVISASAYSPFKQYYPKPGWVEHDANEIYSSALKVIARALRLASSSSSAIVSIGITNQRETVVAWNKHTARPLCRAIVWQDRRTENLCARLKKKSYEPLIRSKTGLVLDPYFSATKINWIFKNIPKARALANAGAVLVGTIDAWVLWKLTGVHATDPTNASRTLLFNIHTKEWDADLLKLFQVPEKILPKVLPSGSRFGLTRGVKVLHDGIPVCAILGDQQASLYGQGCVNSGDVKNTYGTGCFLMMNAGAKKPKTVSGLLTTLAADRNGNPVYAFEGAIFIAGAVVQWLRDELKIIKNADETEKLALSVSDTHGVVIIPAFAGLGSPYWRSDIRGAVSGITRGVSRAHFVRAALESIAQQSADVLVSMQQACRLPIKEIRVDGKASLNKFLMQFQADLAGITVKASKQAEITAWGVALLAGQHVGFWDKKFDSSRALKYRQYYPQWTVSRRKNARAVWAREINFLLSRNS